MIVSSIARDLLLATEIYDMITDPAVSPPVDIEAFASWPKHAQKELVEECETATTNLMIVSSFVRNPLLVHKIYGMIADPTQPPPVDIKAFASWPKHAQKKLVEECEKAVVYLACSVEIWDSIDTEVMGVLVNMSWDEVMIRTASPEAMQMAVNEARKFLNKV